MNTRTSNYGLIFGLAAAGLALVYAGVRFYRRRAENKAISTAPAPDYPSPHSASTAAPAPTPFDASPAASPGALSAGEHPPLVAYFALVTALSVPFWIFGEKPLPLPVKLPTSALMLVNPLLAALILTYRKSGGKGIQKLLKHIWDFHKTKNKAWYLAVLFLYPVIMLFTYGLMRGLERPLPADPQIPWLMVPVVLVIFFVAGIGEELGWMGYAFDPMQDRWGALKASILLGLFWAAIHIIPDIQNGQSANWILWQRVGTLALRVLFAWIYNNTGQSVFSTILFHAAINLGWALFPNYGSHYDPMISGILTSLAAGLVVIFRDSNTLTRPRFGRWLQTSGGAGRPSR